MKLMVVIPSMRRGGAERVVSLLTSAWAKDHCVSVVVFDGTAPAYPVAGICIDLCCPPKEGIGAKVLNAFRRVCRLVLLIRKKRPEAIVAFMESANFPVIGACLIRGETNRLTVSIRNNPDFFGIVHRLLIRLLYKYAARVVASSEALKDELPKFGVPKSKLVSIPNPVVCRRSSEIATSSPFALGRYVLAMGRLVPQKGFDRLIYAYSQLDEADVHLVIIGDGFGRANLVKLVQRYSLKNRVHILSATDDPFTWYRYAECFVLSSVYEGWPNVLMEAMSCRCPPVSFDCPFGPREIIEHGASGILVPNGDVRGLALSIQNVLTDPSLREKLAEGAIRRASQFDLDLIAKRWIALVSACPTGNAEAEGRVG